MVSLGIWFYAESDNRRKIGSDSREAHEAYKKAGSNSCDEGHSVVAALQAGTEMAVSV